MAMHAMDVETKEHFFTERTRGRCLHFQCNTSTTTHNQKRGIEIKVPLK